MYDTAYRPPFPLLLLLVACIDKAGEETGVDVPVDSAEEASCLTVEPSAVELAGETRTAFVVPSGCVLAVSCSCSSPFTCTMSAAVSGSWVVAVDPSTSTDVAGACELTSSEGTASVAVAYTP